MDLRRTRPVERWQPTVQDNRSDEAENTERAGDSEQPLRCPKIGRRTERELEAKVPELCAVSSQRAY